MLNNNKLLRLPQVLELIGFKKTKLWKMVKERKFPKPKKLGRKISVWSFNEVQNWIDNVITKEELHG